MRPRQRVSSTRLPAKPSRAGSRVSEAIDRDGHDGGGGDGEAGDEARSMSSMPSSEITTVVPAKDTARPAVSMARTVASSVEAPLWRFSRNRVTMNRA